jgi:hypothetical protein
MFRMEKWPAVVAALVGAVALVPAVVSAQAATDWRANLTGANEVPSNASTATGTFTAKLDENARTLTWTLKVPSINGATMAHIHSGAAGANGPIVVTLFSAGSPQGFSSIDTYGTARNVDIVGPLAGDFASFASALRAGTLYVNVHTAALPAGEIRAQITQSTATATPTATAKGTATATPSPAATAKAATPAPTVKAAVPAAPKSGSGGFLEGSNSIVLWALALGAAGAGLAAAGLRSRNRTR